MLIVGLTGGIASGKSTVSLLLKNKGAVIIDADEISRNILIPGKPAWTKVIEHFGEKVLRDDKNIDRKKLAQIVFSDKKELELLNSITHPIIIEEIKRQLEYYKKEDEEVVVIDAALLLELGLNSLVDEVWVVAVDEKTQLERLMLREKNLSRKEALKRIKSQMPLQDKLKYAQRIIDNTGEIERTKKQLDEIWRGILKS
ncbi:MAG TPA: dephospho-CoA kinase [Thermoanaerobacterales bacterium]|nr:dephospho-CoA kinase [Thermoanaerobacterales bacterium]